MGTIFIRITDYLLAQSWQIAVLVAVIAAINLALRNRSAHVRYLLWLIVLAKCLVPPLYTLPLAILPQTEPAGSAPISPTIEMLPVNSQLADAAIARPPGAPPAPPTMEALPTTKETRAKVPIRVWLGAGWLVGATAMLILNLMKALRANFWLWRRRKAVPDELRTDIESLLVAHGIRSLPGVWLVDGFAQPFVWGLLRGSIYLPADFLNTNKPEHRISVLGHEISHILRFDAAVNLLQVIAQAVFWFHPFVWWANRKIRAEREKCCDEMAIARLKTTPRDYSTAIVEILASKYEPTRPVPSLAVAGPVRNIEERIRTMLRPGKKFYKRPTLVAATAVLVLAMVTVPTALVLTARAKTEAATEHAEKRYASLYEAAKAGDLSEVKRLITEGANVNAFDKEDQRTPLGIATNERHTEIVKLLLDSGANVNIADSYYSPLYYAIWNDDNNTVKALIDGGADVNLTPEDEDTPLIWAIWEWQTEIVRTLLDAGANTEKKDNSGMSPLQNAINMGIPDMVKLLINTDDNVPNFHMAALKGDISRLQELLKSGADINKDDESGLTPIRYALAGGQGNAAKFLLDQGADINITPRQLSRIISEAAKAGLIDIVRILIEGGLPASGFGWSALHQAVQGNHIDVVKLLIEKGADVNATIFTGLTPLDIAEKNGQPEIVELLKQNGAKESPPSLTEIVRSSDIEELNRLISQGADLNVTSANGGTLLHIAAETGNKDIAELLINNGADVNAKNRSNVTPLHLGVENGNKDVVELLIANGADVNAKRNTRSRQASTALHDAVDGARGDIVELLIAHGADVNARTDSGITPLYIAEQNGYTEIVGLLLKHGAKEISPSLFGAYAYGDIEQIQALLSQGADVNAKNNSGQTLLHLACCYAGNKEVAELLIDKGTDINAKTTGRTPPSWNVGMTPLHYAVQFGHKDIVELLIDKGADVNAEDSRGQTPLDCAELPNNAEIAELLRKHGAKE